MDMDQLIGSEHTHLEPALSSPSLPVRQRRNNRKEVIWSRHITTTYSPTACRERERERAREKLAERSMQPHLLRESHEVIDQSNPTMCSPVLLKMPVLYLICFKKNHISQ
jgi:hypothetical protein